MLSLLTECTILMLNVLYDMYGKRRISYDEFMYNTEVKIKFLLDNMDTISTEIEKENAYEIINKCTSMKKNDVQTTQDVFCFNSDIIQ